MFYQKRPCHEVFYTKTNSKERLLGIKTGKTLGEPQVLQRIHVKFVNKAFLSRHYIFVELPPHSDLKIGYIHTVVLNKVQSKIFIVYVSVGYSVSS